ncbi:NAD(P)H-binding protein [Salininema proteolyticum]|uniref:NAD(P)H-binding protein n=1 Tax=Salininema proteolyticum TaxID=1607685 RepID=A0ABV8TWF1_9ACTN
MYLITGATGTVGRPLIDALLERGAPVRALTRDPSSADFPERVEVVQGDPSRPESVREHLRGVTAVFMNSAAIGDATEEFAALAAERGVRRLVALAAYNVEEAVALQPSRFIGHRNRECEAAAESSGLEWVSLRPHVYASMAFPLWGEQIRAGDVVSWPYPDFREPILDPRDVSEVAARALLDHDLLGRKPVLTGPEVISNAEMVDAIGKAMGRPLRYHEITPRQTVEAMAAMELPPALAASFLARFVALEDEPPVVTDEIEGILGRPARTYGEWAADHAGALARP